MYSRVIGFIIFSTAVLICGFNVLHDTGIVGQTKKPLVAPLFSVKGCFCHTPDTPSVQTRVWVAGPESLAAGRQALYSINVEKDSNVAAGFDVAAFLGDLGIYDSAETQLMRIDPSNPVDSLELTHSVPKLAGVHDTISWSFYYRAPLAVGSVDTIYASGNSVDLSLDPAGDYWNYAPNFLVRITSSVDVREQPVAQSFRLNQNYPNPFNPSTLIKFEMPATGRASLSVFDMTGRKVKELVNEYMVRGSHEVQFVADDGAKLSSGVYFYQLVVEPLDGVQGARLVKTKKMVLLK